MPCLLAYEELIRRLNSPESVVIIPRHGIQLETHRGLLFSLLPACPLTINRRFIPLTSVRDIVINEGIRRWGVRYYLCIVRDVGSEVTLEVAFEVGLPKTLFEVRHTKITRIFCLPSQSWTLHIATFMRFYHRRHLLHCLQWMFNRHSSRQAKPCKCTIIRMTFPSFVQCITRKSPL